MLFLHFTGSSTEIRVEPLENVINSLWSGNDVERWGDRATILKIGNPQFTSGKLPFCVRLLLMKLKLNFVETESEFKQALILK